MSPIGRWRAPCSERWFLHSDGDAAEAGGGLSRTAPAEEPPDTFRFDPRDPAPTIGGPTSLPGKFMRTNAGPLDQRPLEGRGDVLVYTSEPLPEDLEVTGPLSLTLHAATSARDADCVAKLCDVAARRVLPDPGGGRPAGQFPRGLRAAIRGRARTPVRVHGRPEGDEQRVPAGHRIRLLLTSSSFPRFDRNSGAALAPGEVRERGSARRRADDLPRRRPRLLAGVAGRPG